MSAVASRLAWTTLCLALASNCGGSSSPVAPVIITPPAINIAGGYSGTLETTNYSTVSVVVDLNQSGSAVTGTWAQTSSGAIQPFGNITGTTDTAGSFSGTLTFNYTNGPTCSGALTGTGLTAAPQTMTLSSVGLATGNCGVSPNGNPVGIKFVLQRR